MEAEGTPPSGPPLSPAGRAPTQRRAGHGGQAPASTWASPVNQHTLWSLSRVCISNKHKTSHKLLYFSRYRALTSVTRTWAHLAVKPHISQGPWKHAWATWWMSYGASSSALLNCTNHLCANTALQQRMLLPFQHRTCTYSDTSYQQTGAFSPKLTSTRQTPRDQHSKGSKPSR